MARHGEGNPGFGLARHRPPSQATGTVSLLLRGKRRRLRFRSSPTSSKAPVALASLVAVPPGLRCRWGGVEVELLFRLPACSRRALALEIHPAWWLLSRCCSGTRAWLLRRALLLPLRRRRLQAPPSRPVRDLHGGRSSAVNLNSDYPYFEGRIHSGLRLLTMSPPLQVTSRVSGVGFRASCVGGAL